jgi:hypothetical protein
MARTDNMIGFFAALAAERLTEEVSRVGSAQASWCADASGG